MLSLPLHEVPSLVHVDQVVSLTECIIFLLGILAVYRQQTQELIATGLNVNEFDPSNGIEVILI